jgi:hypothetical protein
MEALTKTKVEPSQCRPNRQRHRCSKPFDVWVLEKIWLNDGIFDRSDCYAFNSFFAANRAMFDDWTEEYGGHLDDDNEDGYWEDQVRPFEQDDEAEIKFRDGTEIKWVIHNRSIEGLNPLWDRKEM